MAASISSASSWNELHSAMPRNPFDLRRMILEFALSEDISNLQLSFLDNAATRGEIGGTIPVIEFDATLSGTISLELTLKQMGDVSMGLRTITSTGSDWAMYESRWRIVP